MTDVPAPHTREIATRLRALCHDMISSAGFGFFGSCNSAADAYACALSHFCGDHDEIVLSKGHAAPLVYASWHGPHWGDQGAYAGFGSALQGHPSRLHDARTPLTSGSLGLALAMAVGRHEARRGKDPDARTVVLAGESELQAGCALEAVRYQQLHGAPGFVLLLDVNERQSGGDRIPWAPETLPRGILCDHVDGHDHDALLATYRALDPRSRLAVVVLRTSRSHGLNDPGCETRMSHVPAAKELS